jgi:hypothetical protein
MPIAFLVYCYFLYRSRVTSAKTVEMSSLSSKDLLCASCSNGDNHGFVYTLSHVVTTQSITEVIL